MAGTLCKPGKTYWGRIKRNGKTFERSLGTRNRSIARGRLTAWAAELKGIGWGERPQKSIAAAIDDLNQSNFKFWSQVEPNDAQSAMCI